MKAETAGRTGQLLPGRAHELAIIEAAIAAATRRRPSVIVVEGGWGSGKSSLLDHVRALADEHRLAVVSARAGVASAGDGPSFVADLLERLRRVAVEPAADWSLARAVTLIAAELPLVLCIDDAHELDGESAPSLVELLARLDGLPVVLVLAGSPRPSVAWDAVRAAVTRAPGAQFLRLDPLDRAVAGGVMAGEVALEITEDLLDAAYGLSAGNPFLLQACIDMARRGTSLASPAVADVPEVLRHRLAALLHDLDPPARWLAEATAIAAMAGDADTSTYTHVVLGVAGLDREASAIAIDQLVDAGLFASRDLRFAAPLVAMAIAAAMPGSRREQLHSALANALWSAGATNELVVEHLRRTSPGRSAWAVGMLRSAAADAAAVGDRNTAVALLRRALDEHPIDPVRASLVAELARAEAAAGSPQAVERLDHAVALQPAERRAELQYAVGRSLLAAGRARDAATVFERALHQRADGGWPLLFRAGLLEAARLHPQLWTTARGTLDELLVDEPKPLDGGSRAALAERAFEMVARSEPAHDVAAIARRALPPIESAGVDDPALLTASGVLIYVGDVDAALVALDAALDRLDAGGEGSPAAAGLRFRRGQCLAFKGDLRAAHDELSFALATEQHGWAQYVVGAQAHLARVQVEMADLDSAGSLLRTALASPEARESTLSAELYEAQGRLHLSQRCPADALAAFREAGRRAVEVFECTNPSMLPWRGGAAFAANRLGAHAAAQRLAEDEVRDARRFGEPRALARALRVSGLIRRGDAGIDVLLDALDIVDNTAARHEHAYILADLGDALRRAGRLRDARVRLRAAADLADRLRAATLAGRVAMSMRLAGGRPRRTRVTGPLALTAAEQRVAQRARDGATNREIAQELYVTPKAIEYHLANVYRKLGIRSRRELGAALADDA